MGDRSQEVGETGIVEWGRHGGVERARFFYGLVDGGGCAFQSEVVVRKNFAAVDADGAAFLEDGIGTAQPTEVVPPFADEMNGESTEGAEGEGAEAAGDAFAEAVAWAEHEAGRDFAQEVFEAVADGAVFCEAGAVPPIEARAGFAVRVVGEEAHLEDAQAAGEGEGFLDFVRARDFIEIRHHDDIAIFGVGESALEGRALEGFALPVFCEAFLGREIFDDDVADAGVKFREADFVFQVVERFGFAAIGEGGFADDEGVHDGGEGAEADFEEVEFVEKWEAIKKAWSGHGVGEYFSKAGKRSGDREGCGSRCE